MSSSQISEAVPGLSFCGLVDQGRVLISLLLVPFPFKILYQIQVKREMILRLLLHLQDGSKAWEREWGWGKGKAWRRGSFLLVVILGAGKPAALKYLSVPSCQVLKFPQESATLKGIVSPGGPARSAATHSTTAHN